MVLLCVRVAFFIHDTDVEAAFNPDCRFRFGIYVFYLREIDILWGFLNLGMDIVNGDISGENRRLADSTIEKCSLNGFISGQTAHLLGLNCNLAGIICFKNKLTLLQPHELTGDPVTVVKDNFIGGSHVGNHCHRKKDPDK